MTGMLERAAEAPAATGAAVPGGRSIWPRLRVDLRLARRQVRRTPGSSALVMLLVLIPVAGMVAAAVFWQSHQPTREQEVQLQLGQTASRIEIIGGADPSRTQAVDSLWEYDVARDPDTGVPVNDEGEWPTGIDGVVPADSVVYPVAEYTQVVAETPNGFGRVTASTGDVWADAFEGRYLLLDGARPTAADGEATATPGMLERLGLGIGDDMVLDDGSTYTLTGTMRRADMRPSDEMLFLPASAAEGEGTLWFTADWQPTLAELEQLNTEGFIVYARDLALDPPAEARVSEFDSGTEQGWVLLLYGSVIAAFAGYLVVLLAGAAFAVAARRQQRTLAVAGSVGAGRADVFRIVLLQGSVLGAVGGLLGGGVGLGVAAAVIALTDDGAVGTFWGVWGYAVPWPLVAGILVFAVAVGTIAAFAPARAATRGDVLHALRGARRPTRLDAKRPLFGALLVAVGLVGTVAGALALVVLDAAAVVDYAHPLRTAALIAIVLGPLLFQVGVLVAGHWIISLVARGLSRVSLSARIAARDAAANPSRVVPAFAAIAACVFLASFALSAVSTSTASSNRQYWWSAPLGAVSVSTWGDDADAARGMAEQARRILEQESPQRIVTAEAPVAPAWDDRANAPVDAEAPIWSVAGQSSEQCVECGGAVNLANGTLTVASPDDVAALLPGDVSDAAVEAFRAGAAIVTDPMYLSDAGRVQLTRWTSGSQEAFYDAMNTVYASDLTPAEQDAALPDPDEVATLDGVRIDGAEGQQYAVLVTPETAAELGIDTAPTAVVALFDGVQDDAVYDRLTAAVDNAATADGELYLSVEYGPQPADPWLWLIAAAAVALVVGAGAVCLGLARFERRPDDATLTAVGGSIRVRRAINAWQGAIIVGIGAVVGTIAGQIPMWGVTQSATSIQYWQDAPWLWLAVLAIGLPLVVTIASWLVPPRRPELTRRTAIA